MKPIILLPVILWSTVLFADMKVIELTDGSRIKGEIVSMQDERYTVRTEMLGTLVLNASQIVSIGSPGSNSAAPASAPGVLQSIQEKMTSNPSLMAEVLRLQSDPQMQALLSDPEVMRAVQSFDLDALASNPKVRALMNTPAVKEIQAGVQ